MADVLDSTPAPSRRRFIGSAIAAGVLVAQSPLFIEPDPLDSAVMRLASLATALRAKEQACGDAMHQLETRCHEVAGPAPKKPVRSRTVSANWADHGAAAAAWWAVVDSYEAEAKARDARLVAAGEALGFGEAEAAWNASVAAFWKAMNELVATRATTLEGVIAKARLADKERDDDLIASIIADLVAMKGSP